MKKILWIILALSAAFSNAAEDKSEKKATFRLPDFKRVNIPKIEDTPFTPLRRVEKKDMSTLINNIKATIIGVSIDPLIGGVVIMKDNKKMIEGDKYPYDRIIIERDEKGNDRENMVKGQLTLELITMQKIIFKDEESGELIVPVSQESDDNTLLGIFVGTGIVIHPEGYVLFYLPGKKPIKEQKYTFSFHVASGRFEGETIFQDDTTRMVLLKTKKPLKSKLPFATPAMNNPASGVDLNLFSYINSDLGPELKGLVAQLFNVSSTGVISFKGQSPSTGMIVLDQNGKFVGIAEKQVDQGIINIQTPTSMPKVMRFMESPGDPIPATINDVIAIVTVR